MSNSDTHDGIFEAGYEKGRADGIAHALMVMQIAMDYYPSTPSLTAIGILPEPFGGKVCASVNTFGEQCYREGKKDQKAKDERAAAKVTA